MYRSLEPLRFSYEAELHDGERMRRLLRHTGTGNVLGGALCLGFGALLLAAVPFLDRMRLESPELWPVVIAAALMGLAVAFMGIAFLREPLQSPLRRYARQPTAFSIAKGAIIEARYIPADKGRGHFLVTGSFGQAGMFMEAFDADAWSPDGMERKLPIEAWVLYRTAEPRQGTLIGLNP